MVKQPDSIYSKDGSAWDPVILPVFKTGAWHLRGVMGVFDSHTLPPITVMSIEL